MIVTNEIDYAQSGLSLQLANLEHFNRFPDKTSRPDHILWNGIRVKGADRWDVSQRGRVRIELLSAKSGEEHGVDLKIEDGWVELLNGDKIPLLRTWVDPRYDNVVDYPYFTKTGRICVWIVFKRHYKNGRVIEEKWTGNSGFWVEQEGKNQRLYHCSHGMAPTPDFNAFTFRVTVL